MTETNVQPLHDSPALPAPPHNSDLEAALLGAILANNRAYEAVSDSLRPEHFYEPVHGRIYEAAGKLIDNGEKARPLTLRQYFENDEALVKAGGGQYLYDLAASVVSVVNAPDYAKTVVDLYLRRELAALGADMAAAAAAIDTDSTGVGIAEAHAERLDAIMRAPGEARASTTLQAFDAMLERANKAMNAGDITGVPTGLGVLDRMLGGLHPGKMVVVGARPSMGKTAFACTAAWNAAGAGHRVMLFSLEMSDDQIAARIASRETGISVTDIDRGNLDKADYDVLFDARQKTATAPLTIDDSGSLTVAQIRSRARRAKRKGLDLVIVDYLGLITASRESRRKYSDVAEISEMTRELKLLARDLDVPVLLLCQLNRQLENREDKRPTLADLRQSGSIEQDADTVLFLYRDEYYLEKAEPKRQQFKAGETGNQAFQQACDHWADLKGKAAGICEIIIAKNRQGPTGTRKVHFDGPTTSMRDMGDDRQEGMDL